MSLSPTHWMRFVHKGASGFGRIEGAHVLVHVGDMFGAPTPTGLRLSLEEVGFDIPCRPTKMLALWNNFHAAAQKQGWAIPAEPLYFLKSPNSFAAHAARIPAPASYAGRVLYEGELGIVIGKAGRDIALENAMGHVFGYTCVNDLTALDLLRSDPSFPQWTRAKGFDGFGPFGPVIATGLDPATLTVRTSVNGRERQNYKVADMIFPVADLVHFLSRDMALEAGDVISCGTSLGAGPLPAGARVVVSIEGIGALSNTYG